MRNINELAEALNWTHGSREGGKAAVAAYHLKLNRGLADPVRVGGLARLEAAQRGRGGAPLTCRQRSARFCGGARRTMHGQAQ